MPEEIFVFSDTVNKSAQPETSLLPASPALPWAQWVMPSLADALFIAITYVLAFSPVATHLLDDADTGWHIRNGEHILKTFAVPHTDYFSYTMAGHPWYAWEWLYDALLGGIHIYTGLNGVVLFNALIIALTFALLFSLVRRASHLIFAVVAVVLALLSSQVHILARPHVVSWLLTVVWLWVLLDYQEGKRRRLFLLLPLMLAWVNVHGGFLVGLALIGIFTAANLWTYLITTEPFSNTLAKSRVFALMLTGMGAALLTFANPYGYRLHLHIAAYLSNRYFMDSIDEFRSPNFHLTGAKWFLALLLLTVAAAALRRSKASTLDVLLVLFACATGLYAARNIPTAAILLSMVAARWLTDAADTYLQDPAGRDRVRPLLLSLRDFSAGMERLHAQFRGHLFPALVAVVGIAIALNGGRVGKLQVFAAHFDGGKFPVRAVDFISGQGIRERMFNADDWGGFLIYRLPENKVFFDDRHDFYGEVFIRDFMAVANVQYGWRNVLDKYKVEWILLPTQATATGALKEVPGWKPVYDDGQAIIFGRTPSGVSNH